MNNDNNYEFSDCLKSQKFWTPYITSRLSIFLCIAISEIIVFPIIFPEFSLSEKPDSFTAQAFVWAIFIALYPFGEALTVFWKSVFDTTSFEIFKKGFIDDIRRKNEEKIRFKEIEAAHNLTKEENDGCAFLLFITIIIVIILYFIFSLITPTSAILCGSIFIGICVLVSRR